MENNNIKVARSRLTDDITNTREYSQFSRLQETSYTVSPDGGTTQVGSCEVRFLPRSVTEETKVKLTLTAPSRSPEGHVRASATLTCYPSTKFRKPVLIQLPTWFVAKKTFDVSIFSEKSDGFWKELDCAALTDEKFIDIQVKELSNVTAFLNKNYLPDVSIRVKSYLYHNAEGVFKAAFSPYDQVIDGNLNAEMKTQRHVAIIDSMKELTADIGDEIRYILSGKEEKEKMQGKVLIDEAFADEFTGHVSTFDLTATPTAPSYTVKHSRVVRDQCKVIAEETYPVVIQPFEEPTWRSNVEFHSSFRADNMITSVRDVHIDQRHIVDDTKKNTTKKRFDNIVYDQFNQEVTGASEPKLPTGLVVGVAGQRPTQPGITITAGGSNRSSSLKILGDFKVKNMIGNANTVTIDQRKVYKSSLNNNPTTTQAVPAEPDLAFGVQDSEQGSKSRNLTLSEKNDIECMAGSGRAFALPQQEEDQMPRDG